MAAQRIGWHSNMMVSEGTWKELRARCASKVEIQELLMSALTHSLQRIDEKQEAYMQTLVEKAGIQFENCDGWVTTEFIEDFLMSLQNKDWTFVPTTLGNMLMNKSTNVGIKAYHQQALRLASFNKKKVFIPINIRDTHWRLVVVHFDKQLLRIYDSLYSEQVRLDAAMVAFFNETFAKQNWQIRTEMCPQQLDRASCGVFVCLIAKMLRYHGVLAVLPTRPEHVDTFRSTILFAGLNAREKRQNDLQDERDELEKQLFERQYDLSTLLQRFNDIGLRDPYRLSSYLHLFKLNQREKELIQDAYVKYLLSNRQWLPKELAGVPSVIVRGPFVDENRDPIDLTEDSA